MKRNIISLTAGFLLAFFINPGASAADADTSKVWTLEDCMEYAVRNNYNVRRKLIDQDDYRLDYNRQVLSHLPSISGNVGTGLGFGRGIYEETNEVITNTNFNSNYSIGLGLPVFNGLARLNATRMMKVAKLRGVQEQQQVEDLITIEAMKYYMDVVYKMGVVDHSEEQLGESREKLREVLRQRDMGLKTSADVAQIEASVASEEYNLIKSKNGLQIAWVRLKDQMNYPLDRALKIDSELDADIHVGDINENVGDIYETAANILPDAKIAEYSLKSSKLNHSISKGYLYPSINFNAGMSTSYNTLIGGDYNQRNHTPFFRNLDGNLGKSLSASLNIPIFNGLSNRINVKKTRNEVKRSEIILDETMRQIHSAIEQAVIDLESAQEQYQQAQKNVTSTEWAYRLNKRKYEEGLTTAIEFQTSSNQLLMAKVELLNSRLTYIAQRRIVNYYKGIPLLEF